MSAPPTHDHTRTPQRRSAPLDPTDRPGSALANPARYLIAVAACAVAVVVSLMLASGIASVIFIFFWPAVFVSAWFGGRGPAWLATVLSVLLVNQFLVEPAGSTVSENPESLIALGFFLVLGGSVGEVTARFRRTQAELHRMAADAAERAEQLQGQAIELEAQTEEAQTLTEELEETNAALDGARAHAEDRRRRLELVLDTLPDAVNVYDANWRWTYINPVSAGTLRASGKDPGALIGRVVWDELPELAATKFYSECHRAAAYHHPVEFEEFFAPLGRWFENRVVPGDGHTVAYSRDVTERKRVEEALRDSERRFRKMFDENPLPMWVFDSETLAFLAVNDSACTHYGHSPAEFLGMTMRDVRPPSQVAVLEEPLAAATEGLALRGLHRHWTKDRIVIDVEVSTQTIDYEGRSARLAIVVDVTDRERLFRTEQEARSQAEKANRAKTDFLATMSHELRTPLNAIAGYTELLEVGILGPITEKQRESLARIQRSQRHLLSLINDVLNFAKLSAGRVEYDITDVPVPALVRAVEEFVSVQLEGKSIEFRRTECDDGQIVRADADKLQQILLNLLSNAIKFTPQGGRVLLSCAGAGDMVAITVEDTGIGIPEDRLGQIFEPFVQVDRRLNSRHEGTGLGLSISRDLARAMGGDISVRSELGRGSAFTVTLPRA
jgi:PAS domain S-box-containing protein